MRRYKIALKVGKRIRIIRKKKRLTQEEVAGMAKIDMSTLGRIERGETNAPIQTINKIAQALKVKPKDLLP
jgi:transcriptional regulator with XRE-family HTH domain